MKLVLSKFGVYTNHLIALSEDRTVKSADQAKLRGYCIKWVNAKYILGCAFFCELLSPCAIFSKVLQHDSLDILGAFTSLLRTIQELDKLSSKSLKHWHTYSTTCKSVTTDDDKKFYQQQCYSEAEQYFTANFEEYCKSVIRSRLRWTDVEFVRDVILFLTTQGWQKLDEQSGSSEGYDDAIVRLYICTKFTIPLEAAGVESKI